MNKISKYLILLKLALFLSSNLFAKDKPNVLFIFADDQCYKTIASLNNDEIQTPHLDRLVSNGTTFTHTYNMGGYHGAVCVASRTMLITGKHIWHAKNSEKNLKKSLDGKLWPQLMAKAGYDTFFTGKWHVKADANHLFGTARNVRGGMPRQTKEGYNRPLADGTDPWDPSDPKFGGFWAGGKHWSEVVADDAIDYLDLSKKSENPFFMYIAFNAPHDPRQAPEKYVDMYPTNKIKIPKSFLKEHPLKEEIGSGKGLRDEKLAPFPRTKHAVQVNRREYYAIITHMDFQIGRILDHLDKTGQADNTYIFFTADHGLSVGHHGLLGKQNLYDHSVRVPLISTFPCIEKDKNNIYHPRLISNDQYNAFVTGSNKVYINTGLIKKSKSISEIQGVFAHEIGHLALNHHSSRSINNKSLSNYGKFASIVGCLLYTSPSPRDRQKCRMPSSA